jgi:hypothetical protein
MATKLGLKSGKTLLKDLKIKQVIPKEHDEQVAFVTWFKYQFPHVRIAAIPNGLRTSIRQAIKAKREGMSAGYPDLHIPAWNLYIEMKRQKGGVLSPEQKSWHQYLEDHCSSTVIVAKGCEDAIKKLQDFLTRNKK